MAKRYEGHLLGSRKRFAIVVSRFNDFITKQMLEAAENTLLRHGVPADNITVAWVPGSLEIPLTAQKIAEKKNLDAIICLGCIIRGDTLHFDLVASETAHGIAQVGLRSGIPTIFGVITANTLEQAIERAGTKMGNKGADAALAALEMADLIQKMTQATLKLKSKVLQYEKKDRRTGTGTTGPLPT